MLEKSQRKFEIGVLLFNGIVLLIFLVAFLNWAYPDVGSDYRYCIPHLLDAYLHFKVNGLSIQWYTPSFGGGLPAYPNPNNLQFSLPEFLMVWMDPWTAVVTSVVIYAIIGFYSIYYFFNRILGMRWGTSILGAFFFVANGFFFWHSAIGHMGYEAYPLLAVIIIALFVPRIPESVSAILIALVVTLLIHSAGFYLLAIYFFALIIALPILYLCKPAVFNFKRLLKITAIALVFTFFLAGSKLAAIYAFMRFFPREMHDVYQGAVIRRLIGIGMQLAGSTLLGPVRWLRGKDVYTMALNLRAWTGSTYNLWETDIAISPVLIGILSLGTPFILLRDRKYFLSNFWKGLKSRKGWGIAILMLILGTWILVEFRLAQGLIYPRLETLPVIKSMHVNVRFTSAFILPLCLLGTMIYERFSSTWPKNRSMVYSLILNILAIAFLGLYFPYTKGMVGYKTRSFSLSTSLEAYSQIKAGETFPVNQIADVKDSDSFVANSSSLTPYEPIFGYGLDTFLPQIKVGPVTEIHDGYFNMTDPSGFVFPKENHTTAFERIPATDANKLEAFINRRQPDWKRPELQDILDVAALGALIVSAGILVTFLLKRSIRKFLRPK